MFKKLKCLIVVCISFTIIGCVTVPDNIGLIKKDAETLFIKNNNYSGLLKLYGNALKESPNNLNIRLKLIDTYIKMHNYISAKFYLAPLLASNKPNSLALFYMAQIYFNTGHFDDAKKYLLRSIKTMEYPRAHVLMGEIYTYEKKYKQAISEFMYAWHTGFSQSKSINNIAVVYLVKKDYKEVINLLYPLYKFGNRDTKLLNNLAYSLSKTGNKKEAQVVANINKK